MNDFRIAVFVILTTVICLSCKENISLFEAGCDTWLQKGDARWEFVNGEIYGSNLKGTGFLITKDSYGNFELTLEFYPDETINSGVFVRCKNYALSYTDCYEINIWDFHPEPLDRTGAIVSRSNPLTHVVTVNKWNTYKIRCNKSRIQAWINGELVADLENEDLKEGYIALQADQIGSIKFRNITLIPL